MVRDCVRQSNRYASATRRPRRYSRCEVWPAAWLVSSKPVAAQAEGLGTWSAMVGFGMELESQSANDFEDGVEAGAALTRKCLVKAFAG